MREYRCRFPFPLAAVAVFLLALAASAAIAHPIGFSTEAGLDGDGRVAVRTVAIAPVPIPGESEAPIHPAAPPVLSIPSDYLWVDLLHYNAVAERVAVTGDGLHAFAGWWLNNKRAALYSISAGSAPSWAFPMPAAQFQIDVAADLVGDKLATTAREEPLYTFTTAGPPPVATHAWDPPILGYHVAVSRSGNTYAAAGGDPVAGGQGELRVFDGSGAFRFSAPLASQPEGVNVSADGLVVVANTRHYAKVWDAMTGAERDSIPIPGENQVPAVLSGDGSLLATGGFGRTVRLYEWNGTAYVQNWSHNITGITWIVSLAISDDGSMLAAGTWSTAPAGRVVLYSTGSNQPIWTDDTYGDSVKSIALTPDGSRLVAGSYGRLDANVGNVVSVYDTDSPTPVHAIGDGQYPGVASCHSVDISEDGTIVVAGGKAVHAYEMGNGGWVMAIEVDATASVDGWQSDGVSDGRQSPAFLTLHPAVPNPATGVTRLEFGIPSSGIASLGVYDVAGREVRSLRSGDLHAGWHSVTWDGRGNDGVRLPQGVYFARLRAGTEVRTERVTIIR